MRETTTRLPLRCPYQERGPAAETSRYSKGRKVSEETKNDQPGSATADGATKLGYSDPGFAERYGVKSGMSRTRKILLAVFGLALLGGVVGYIAWNEANPKIQAEVISYTVNGKAINVTFQVNKSADQRVECTIEALDTHGSVIGSATVVVPTGRAQEDMVYTVNTTGTPNTATVPSCTAVS